MVIETVASHQRAVYLTALAQACPIHSAASVVSPSKEGWSTAARRVRMPVVERSERIAFRTRPNRNSKQLEFKLVHAMHSKSPSAGVSRMHAAKLLFAGLAAVAGLMVPGASGANLLSDADFNAPVPHCYAVC